MVGINMYNLDPRVRGGDDLLVERRAVRALQGDLTTQNVVIPAEAG